MSISSLDELCAEIKARELDAESDSIIQLGDLCDLAEQNGWIVESDWSSYMFGNPISFSAIDMDTLLVVSLPEDSFLELFRK